MMVIVLAMVAVVVVWLQIRSLRQTAENNTKISSVAKNKRHVKNNEHEKKTELLVYCLLMGAALVLSALQLFDIRLASPLSLIEWIFTPVSNQLTNWLGLS